MFINFHDEKNRFAYASRQADQTWTHLIEEIVDVNGKRGLDIGCGGGIYAKQFAEMGAKQVTGIDFSEQSLAGAREFCKDHQNIDFYKGNALDTNQPSDSFDIILERSLDHLDCC